MFVQKADLKGLPGFDYHLAYANLKDFDHFLKFFLNVNKNKH